MDSINITNARKDLYNLVARTQDSHEPVQIVGKNATAVLVSSEDWDAIIETLYLVNIPGMAESILEAAKEPLDEGTDMEDLDWDV
ncbi:type II toxin-antitoxin system Phd/YefM family antitoxin [Solibaculum mannosilyticum]|uniref:type II toxin-antitoxin system Phd/YefM family antitoxin n=1 Tax=Solibaculum mannosilyticum TaxID=2780922 RepID=UPI0034BB2B04